VPSSRRVFDEVSEPPRDPYFPGRAAIEGYGAGGFRFAGMSHRGSLLLVPQGIWAWAPASVAEIDEASLGRVFDQRDEIDLLLIGTGRDPVPLPEALRWRLRELGIHHDMMPTAAAASTYNVLLAEGRRVAAALIATE
jgi:uncharacterized protein